MLSQFLHLQYGGPPWGQGPPPNNNQNPYEFGAPSYNQGPPQGQYNNGPPQNQGYNNGPPQGQGYGPPQGGYNNDQYGQQPYGGQQPQWNGPPQNNNNNNQWGGGGGGGARGGTMEATAAATSILHSMGQTVAPAQVQAALKQAHMLACMHERAQYSRTSAQGVILASCSPCSTGCGLPILTGSSTASQGAAMTASVLPHHASRVLEDILAGIDVI